MVKYVVAFNGPPRSGKDTIANKLQEQLDVNYGPRFTGRLQLSLPMRKAAMALCGMEYDEEIYEKKKDSEVFGEHTLREMMIALSELHIKPTYGNTFWVEQAFATQVMHRNKIAIISDLGFQEEIEWIHEEFLPRNVLVVNLTRDHTTWNGDSRQPLRGHQTLDLYNNGTASNAATAIRHELKRIGWQLTWSL